MIVADEAVRFRPAGVVEQSHPSAASPTAWTEAGLFLSSWALCWRGIPTNPRTVTDSFIKMEWSDKRHRYKGNQVWILSLPPISSSGIKHGGVCVTAVTMVTH